MLGRLNKEGKDIAASPVSEAQLGAILDLIADGTISGKIAKDVFEIVWNEGGDPRAIVEARGLKQVTDVSALEKLVDDIIAKNPDKVGDAKTNPKAIGWFVGQVMKASGGKANPQAVNDLLKKRIGDLSATRSVAARDAKTPSRSSRNAKTNAKNPLACAPDGRRARRAKRANRSALIRAFCARVRPHNAPANGLRRKIFSRGECVVARANARAKTRDDGRASARNLRCDARCNVSRNPLFHRHFLLTLKFRAPVASPQNLFTRARSLASAAR